MEKLEWLEKQTFKGIKTIEMCQMGVLAHPLRQSRTSLDTLVVCGLNDTAQHYGTLYIRPFLKLIADITSITQKMMGFINILR